MHLLERKGKEGWKMEDKYCLVVPFFNIRSFFSGMFFLFVLRKRGTLKSMVTFFANVGSQGLSSHGLRGIDRTHLDHHGLTLDL